MAELLYNRYHNDATPVTQPTSIQNYFKKDDSLTDEDIKKIENIMLE